MRRRNHHLKAAAGLHTIACFEATKGALVIVVGLGLLSLIHRDVEALAEQIVAHFHLNPANAAPRIFLELADRASDSRLQALATGAIGYATLRFIEAWGLWRDRIWAQWLGIISGGIYLPVEIYELWRGVTAIRAGTFLLNLVIVAWLARVRWLEHRER